jgi:putative tryptophan/tyrosine transport system substrate-binding protein
VSPRRFFPALFALVVSGLISQSALAQKLARIGFLSVSEPELSLDPFRDGLRQLGYIEGKNIAIEVRFAMTQPSRLPQLAAELVASKVDVILAGGSDSIRAAQRATKTIPIVMTQTSDAVGSGFVANLGRPGGNITGLSNQVAVGGKRLQMIKELVPRAERIAVLVNPANPAHPPGLKVLEKAAQSLRVQILSVEVREAELEDAFGKMAKLGVGALLLLPDTMLFNQRDRIVRLAAQAGLPAVHWRKEWVEAGGLISYGQDNPALYREAAAYVHKILKGAKPGELAVEQPAKFELFVNLKTAKALGIAVPQSIRLQADKVIE